ncbi:MAG: DUF1015 domain-containing protein [Acidobacteria bacterium]|nr:DUF1015 domain-containing protein [Acidobacteriota bacterium]
MANVSPFRPYRYAPSAGDANDLVTQPYDKINPAMRQRYLSLSPYNLVRIILGEKQPADTDTDNIYTRASCYLNDWIGKGVLTQDPAPAFYAYFQEFTPPDSQQRLTRKGFIGLGAVEDYSANIVHRHEQTLSGPKKDRMQVLSHTRAHFGQIFMLYPDRQGVVDRILDEAAQGEPIAVVTDEYGATHRLWRIDDAAKIAAIRAAMSDKKLLIADGHHRYETALNFHKDHPELADAGNVMMTFVNMYSPGLKILATHRVLSNLDSFDFNEFVEKVSKGFTLHRVPDVQSLRAMLDDASMVRIGVVSKTSSKYLLLERERRPEDLDVRILHDTLLRDTMGIGEEAVRDEKHIRYVRGVEAAVEAVRGGDAQIAFLLQPTSVQQTADVSFGGGVMPQKSTDFYPKLLSGMTIYRLEK